MEFIDNAGFRKGILTIPRFVTHRGTHPIYYREEYVGSIRRGLDYRGENPALWYAEGFMVILDERGDTVYTSAYSGHYTPARAACALVLHSAMHTRWVLNRIRRRAKGRE